MHKITTQQALNVLSEDMLFLTQFKPHAAEAYLNSLLEQGYVDDDISTDEMISFDNATTEDVNRNEVQKALIDVFNQG